VVHYGIVCLSPDVITVLGGLVQSLYEEWQMNQKYAGFSRSSLRLGREGDAGGPPPFEKLQIGGPNHAFTRNGIVPILFAFLFHHLDGWILFEAIYLCPSPVEKKLHKRCLDLMGSILLFACLFR